MGAPDLFELFVMEAEDMLYELENGLILMEESSFEEETTNSVFRAAHTIKGGAGLAGLSDITEFVHTVENVLERVRSQQIPVTKPLITTMLKSVDVIREMIAQETGDIPMDEIEGHEHCVDSLQVYLAQS